MEDQIYIQVVEDMLQAVARHKDDLTAYRQYGCIKVEKLDHLLIFNYTAEAVYENRWTPIERVCRGLIIQWEPEVKLVAWPFIKFFGLDEVEETSYENILKMPYTHITVTEKMDGSLGIIYRYAPGDYRVATRGSFTSPQARWATTWLNLFHLTAEHIKFLDGYPTLPTIMVEIIYPNNQIVVDYGDFQGLVMLGLRYLGSYQDTYYEELKVWSNILDLPLVKQYKFDSFRDIMRAIKSGQISQHNAEGFVVRFGNSQLRVKVKFEEYKELHRILTHFSPEIVRKFMLEHGSRPQLRWNEHTKKLPARLQQPARSVGTVIFEKANRRDKALQQEFNDYFSDIKKRYQVLKAELMAQIQLYTPEDAKYMIKLLTQKSVFNEVLKDLDLSDLPTIQTYLANMEE